MSQNPDAPAEEIIIVRRKSGGEDDCHHGGVWKIAYADFMTAMMAFFLVMWLINAANTEVKASVASYFNPLRLTDSATRKKGLRDLNEKEKSKPDSTSQEGEGAQGPTAKAEVKDSGGSIDNAKDERHRLALSFDRSAPATEREQHTPRQFAASEKGRAFRDPFNPLAPGELLNRESRVPAEGPRGKPRIGPDAIGVDGAQSTSAGQWSTSLKKKTEELAAKHNERERASTSQSTEPKTEGAQSAQPDPQAVEPNKKLQSGPTPEEIARAIRTRQMEDQAAKLKKSVGDAIAALGVSGGPGMDVVIEGDSLVISLTDTSTFGMFAIGSSVPEKELAGLMKSLAPIVQSHGQQIIIRGHTDGRPFQSDVINNNWKLSTSRAEAAYELLIKSGIKEDRFARIEGHADRKLKNSNDPENAVNRRIEILLKQAAS